MMTTTNYYDSIEKAYTDLVMPLSRYAAQHLYRKDEAIDAVHDAFTKAAEYVSKNKERRISRYVLYRETIRACRRRNKKSVEVPHDFSDAVVDEGVKRHLQY
jgi:DNA-directed RNA polymerase specialized sigma24 family protein